MRALLKCKHEQFTHPESMRVRLLSEVSENPAVEVGVAVVVVTPGMLKAKSGHTWYWTQQKPHSWRMQIEYL